MPTFTTPNQAIRLTVFFSDARFSWSETYWANPTLAGRGLSAVLVQGRTLVRARYRLLGSGGTASTTPQIQYIRASDDAVEGDAIVSNEIYGKLGDSIALPMSGRPPERPYSCLLVRMRNTEGHHRDQYLSGIPDDVITDPVGPKIDNVFNSLFKAFKDELVANWGFVTREPASPTELKPVANFTADAALNGTTIMSASVVGLSVDDSIVVTGGKWDHCSNPVRGVYRVFAVGDGSAKLRHSFNPSGYQGGAVYRKLVYRVLPFADGIIVGETHRKRGVRSGSAPLGRSRTKVPRTA